MIVTAELSFPTHASFPAFGFETAVSAAFSTSPPEGSHELLNGEVLKRFVDIKDLLTSLSTIYETSPIEIFLLGQNLSLIELHAGITSFAASVFISFVHLLAPSSEYLSTEPDKFVVLPAFIDLTIKQANSSLATVSLGKISKGLPKQTCIP